MPQSRVNERTLNGKQPNEVAECHNRKVRATTVVRNIANFGSAERHKATKRKNSTSSSDHRTMIGNAKHPAELESPTYPKV